MSYHQVREFTLEASKKSSMDPDLNADSVMKYLVNDEPNIYSNGMDSPVDIKSPNTPSNFVAQSPFSTRLSSLRNSLHLLNISEANTTELSKESKRIEQEVTEILKSWFAAIGLPEHNLKKYSISSSLTGVHALGTKLKPSVNLSIEIFVEILSIIELRPNLVQILGDVFIGSFLCHIVDSLAETTHRVLFSLFKNEPAMRMK